MKREKTIRSLFAKSQVLLGAQVSDRMARNTLSAFDRVGKTQSDASCHRRGKRTVGVRMWKLSAAILVLGAVAFLVHQFGEAIDGSQAALAQVRQAVNRVPWIHVTISGDDPESVRADSEIWFSPQRKIRVFRSGDPNAPVLWSDFLSRQRQLYEPRSNTLTLSHEFKKIHESPDPPWNYVNYIFDSTELGRARITPRVELSEETKVQVYDVAVEENEGTAYLRIVVDLTTGLPMTMGLDAVDAEGRQRGSCHASFEYPPEGPADIYEAGVPGNAKIIDERPTPQAEELAQICKGYRANFRSHVFVVVMRDRGEAVHQIAVNYIDGDTSQAAREWKALSYTYIPWPPLSEGPGVGPFDSTDDVLNWIKNDERIVLGSIRLWDGRHQYRVTRGEEPPYKKIRTVVPVRNVHGYAWLCYVPSGRVIEDEYSRQKDLICWQSGGRAIYFDPSHDYICVRLQQSNGCWIRDTLDFARTDAGFWYPRTVRLTIVKKDAEGVEISREVTVGERLFLKPVLQFPRGTFDPDRCPKTAEALRAYPKLLDVNAF